MRFGTGTDEGMDMLTKHLGFALSDVEMCYFDVEHGHQTGECLHEPLHTGPPWDNERTVRAIRDRPPQPARR